jgi:hypothetical protein
VGIRRRNPDPERRRDYNTPPARRGEMTVPTWGLVIATTVIVGVVGVFIYFFVAIAMMDFGF